MAIVFVGGQTPLTGGGDDGDVYIFLDPSANINFTGLLTVPDQADGNNSARIANTRFVQRAVEQVNGGGGVSVHIADQPPVSANAGALWWDSSDGGMYIRYNNQWVGIGGLGGAGLLSVLGGVITGNLVIDGGLSVTGPVDFGPHS